MAEPFVITEEQLEKENVEIARLYKEMLKNTYITLSDEDKKLIRRAFDLAAVSYTHLTLPTTPYV